MRQVGTLTVTTGTSGRSMTVSQLTGADAISTGTSGRSLAVSQLTGSEASDLGTRGASMSVSSSILGVGYVTTAATAGGVVWTTIANVEADDAATAGWVLSEGVGAGAATTSSGTLTATAPHLGSAPSGFTRTKVETLIHRSDTAVGLSAGDTASFTVGLQDKTGAALQAVLTDTFTAAGSNANAVVATDVTTAVAAISDADLALTKFLLTATFARTLVATGTRSWTVAVDSLALRVTYTRSGIT